MSLAFNTIGGTGILQLCEDYCGFNRGDITGNTELKTRFTGYVNLGLDDILPVIIAASGMWKFDDSNHTDYPFIYTDLVNGQRDYSFIADGSGNLILDIYRVMVADPTGVFSEIYPISQAFPTKKTSGIEDSNSFIDGQNYSGTPKRYDKTGNGIFLDPIPNYDSTGGLKVFINREMIYFTTSDTTKKPGFAGTYHRYLALFASEMFGSMNNLANLVKISNDKTIMKRDIEEYYTKRDKDTPKRLQFNVENNK